MVAAADGSPTPESRQQCSRRTVILGAGGVLLLLAASLVGALLSRTPEARPPKQAPAYDSVTIVDALMVANQMQTPQTGAEVSTTSSNSPGPAPATPPPSAQAPPLGDGSGSPFAAIQSLFVAGANWTGLSIAQQRVSQPGPDGIPAGSVVTQAWKQLAGAGPAGGAAGRSVICYPTTGRELENMVGPQSPCNVLVLRNVPDDEYVIRRTLNVSTAKVLIGSPVAMPVLNCSRGLERLWDSKWLVLVTDLVLGWARHHTSQTSNPTLKPASSSSPLRPQSKLAAVWTPASSPWCAASDGAQGLTTRFA